MAVTGVTALGKGREHVISSEVLTRALFILIRRNNRPCFALKAWDLAPLPNVRGHLDLAHVQ